MTESRRCLLMTLAGIAGVLAAPPVLTSLLAQQTRNPKARTYPNGRDPNAPPEQDEPTRLDPKAIERANQLELKKNVARLYEMVTELRDQVDRMDSIGSLSASVVKQAQQIQKLAKQIQGLAKT